MQLFSADAKKIQKKIQNSPELHFRFINSFIQSSLLESLGALNNKLNHEIELGENSTLSFLVIPQIVNAGPQTES